MRKASTRLTWLRGDSTGRSCGFPLDENARRSARALSRARVRSAAGLYRCRRRSAHTATPARSKTTSPRTRPARRRCPRVVGTGPDGPAPEIPTQRRPAVALRFQTPHSHRRASRPAPAGTLRASPSHFRGVTRTGSSWRACAPRLRTSSRRRAGRRQRSPRSSPGSVFVARRPRRPWSRSGSRSRSCSTLSADSPSTRIRSSLLR